MNWLDVVLLFFLEIGMFLGFKGRLLGTLLPLLGLMVGIVLAGRFYQRLVERMTPPFSEDWASLVVFVLIMVAALGASGLVAFLFRRGLVWKSLSWVDRLAGALLGLFAAGLFAGVFLALLLRYPAINLEGSISHSVMARFLVEQFPLALGLLPGEFDFVRGFYR